MPVRIALILALFASAHAQITLSGNVSLNGSITVGSATAPPFTGGQVNIPMSTVGHPQSYMYNSAATGLTFYSLGGATAPLCPTTDTGCGLWYTNTATAEANPSGTTWTAANHATQPTIGGNYLPFRQLLDMDSDHVVGINGYNGTSANCTAGNSCASTIQVYQISTNAYTQATLPSLPTGQSFVCLAVDSTNTFWAMSQYGGANGAAMWKSPTGTALGTWTQVSSGFKSLPGLSASGGNIYTCKIFGTRIYFGGEGGVISCDLALSACTEDYLPFSSANGQRNFQASMADVNAGSSSNPSIIIECCRYDNTVTNATQVGLYSSSAWTGLISTSSGLPLPGNFAAVFDTGTTLTGTGTARRYYSMQGTAGNLNTSCYKSSSSSGTTWASFYPASWPTGTTTYGLLQINASPAGHMWALFSGTTSGSVNQMFITP